MKWKIGYLGLAVLMLAAGCAEERAPRSFVQPNVIKKADLAGTWYYLQTVTHAPPTNGSAFEGQSSSLMKVVFDIQENHLYARRAFDWVENSDGFWRDPTHKQGAILASWPITSQFDIIRDYNSTTGEQTNKIIESTERPWQDREFIRVDWSQNEVTDYVGIGIDFFFSDGQPQIQNISYWESDPNSPDALHFERSPEDNPDEGFKKDEAIYLDVTNKVELTPDMLTATYQENGQWFQFSYPRCFFGYEQDDCATQEVKIRHAFAKVGPNHDYEPRNWDGKQMNLFGVWDVGLRRLTYNRQYGPTNSGIVRHAARFNIWKKSYTTDANGNKTPIPYKDRELRYIPYYAEGSQPYQLKDGSWDYRFPEDLYPQFQEIIGQWNDAMKSAVKDLTGADAPHDIFVPCHVPVQLGVDNEHCTDGLQAQFDANGNVVKGEDGKPIIRPRQGDPRHSMVFWVDEQQNAGPLGYGPPLYDEETGETISGQAYIYGAALDTYAARSRDLLLLQNGEFSTEDFTAGTNVKEYVAQNKLGVRSKPKTYTPQQAAAAARAMDFSFAKGFTPQNGYPTLDTSSNNALKRSLDARENAIYGNYFGPGGAPDARDTKLSRLIGQPLEKMMVTPDNMAISGVSPMYKWDQLSPIEKQQVSPLREQIMDQNMLQERLKAERLGVDFATFDDEGLSQRVRHYLNDPKWCPDGPDSCELTPKSDELRQDIRKDIFLAVTLHEVGHNMGCRHNFRASYDAMNYFPDYWKIRFEALDNPDPGMAPGDGKLHARYLNQAGGAPSQYELDNGVREKQYSSIMDYGAEFNSDLQGLGLYDKALIKFSYANTVEVFTDAKPDAASTIGTLHAYQNSYGLPSPLLAGNDLAAVPYQSYPDLFNTGWEGIYKRADVPYSDITTQAVGSQGDTILADDEGRPLVPYYFCSDEFVGNLSCQRFDAGPDPYEQAQDLISRYQNFYLYNNFKRDRQSFFTSLGYKSRVASRYFDMLREQLTWYVLLRSDLESFPLTNCQLQGGQNCEGQSKITSNSFFASENGWGGFTLGVSNGFELLGQVLTTPTAGLFYKTTDPAGQTYWKQFRDDIFEGENLGSTIRRVGYLDGKYIDTTWDFDGCGYYWGDECQTRIGYMVDKQVALDVLSQSQAYFTGRDTNTDVRQYAIGYIIPFKKQIEQKFGDIFAGDIHDLAPVYVRQNGDYVPQYQSWVMADPTAFPESGNTNNRIDPATGFTVQLYAGVYGLSSFPTTFDHDFIDHTQIFVVGNGEAPVSDADLLAKGTSDPTELVSHGGTKEWFYYTDAGSGKTYAAHAVPTSPAEVADPTSTDPSHPTKTVALRADTGVRMLERLQKLGQAVDDAGALPVGDQRDAVLAEAQNQYDLYRQNVEVMRSLHNAFGYGSYKSDAPFYY